MRLLYADRAPVKKENYARCFLVYFSACAIDCEKRRVKELPSGKMQKEQEESEAQPDGA
jgi:hypothetical protein